MLKSLSASLLALLLTFPALAETRYISDELYIYLHTGPSNQYRILGSVNAGEKVNLIDYNSETEYGKIVTEAGREGWVEIKNLNRNPGLKAQLASLQQRLDGIDEKHKQEQAQLSTDNSEQAQTIEQQLDQIAGLQDHNQQLQNQLEQLTSQNSELQTTLDSLSQAQQMQWFMRGGMVAGVGLLLGLLIPLIPRRKKQEQRWM